MRCSDVIYLASMVSAVLAVFALVLLLL